MASSFQVNFLDCPSFVCVMKKNLASKQSTPTGFSSGECGRGFGSLNYFLCCPIEWYLTSGGQLDTVQTKYRRLQLCSVTCFKLIEVYVSARKDSPVFPSPFLM